MQPSVSPRLPPGTEPQREAPREPGCPVCGGILIELRGLVRCTRCHFSMCLGCDGGGGPDGCGLAG